MYKNVKIRKNKDRWEHWVPGTNSNQGHWSPGLVGNDDIKLYESNLKPIKRDDMNNIIFNSSDSYKKMGFDIKVTSYNKKDIQIKKSYKLDELINTEDFKPIWNIPLNELLESSQINILVDTNLTVEMSVFNPVVNQTNQDLEFEWSIDGNKLKSDQVIFDLTFDTAVQNEAFSITAKNKYESSTSDIINISVIDPVSNGFTKNHVQNPYALDDFSNWSIGSGQPIRLHTYHYPSKVGLFDQTTSFDKNLFDFDPNNFAHFSGGSAIKNSNRTSTLNQTIDLNSYSDIIDRKVKGINSLKLYFYAMLGSWGNAKNQYFGLYEEPQITYGNNGPINKSINNLDVVVVELDLLDSNDNTISSSNKLSSVIHSTSAKFFLDYDILNSIPVGTRKLNISVRFEKHSQMLNYWNFRSWEFHGPDYDSDLNKSYANMHEAFDKDHLTAVSGVHCIFDINDRYHSDLESKLEQAKAQTDSKTNSVNITGDSTISPNNISYKLPGSIGKTSADTKNNSQYPPLPDRAPTNVDLGITYIDDNNDLYEAYGSRNGYFWQQVYR